MIEVDQYKDIRQLYAVEGLSEREIAKRLGISRNTVSKYKNGQVVVGQRAPQKKTAPTTGPVQSIIEGYLQEDAQAPRKQKHTAKRIFDRLCVEYGFQGAYSTIRRTVREMRGKVSVSIPLEFDLGEAAQVDWGTAFAYVKGVKTKIELFCMRLCHSGAIFVAAFPTQRYESFLLGHRLALEFFGGVPRHIIYDNLKTAVKDGWGKHVTEEQQPFKLLKAHYAFQSKFCNPRRGNEKGLVENLVGFCRNNTMVPMPKVNGFPEISETLRLYCLQYQKHKIPSRTDLVGELLRQERLALTPLPEVHYDCAIVTEAKANASSLIRYDNVYYSVPARLAGLRLTVKAYPLSIEAWHKGEMVTEHTRSYQQGHVAYKVEHYLSVLERKPRAVQNAAPIKRGDLDARIRSYGTKLAERSSDKEFVQILKLVVDYGEEAVIAAIEQASGQELYSYEAVRFSLLQERNPSPTLADNITPHPQWPKVQQVDLGQYDALCKGVASNG